MNRLLVQYIFVCIFLFACSSENKYNFDDDTALLNQIDYQVDTFQSDSSIKFTIDLINNSNKTIFIPVSVWSFDGKRNDSLPSITQPVNPGITNTIHYYPLNNNVFDAPIDIGYGCSNNEYLPSFMKLDASERRLIMTEIPKYQKLESEIINSRFDFGSKYTFMLKLSIISENNLENLLLKTHNIDTPLLDQVSINFPLIARNIPNIIYLETSEPIDKSTCEILQKLATNQLDIYFNITID